jgi:exodeoxyribonuclease VII small subunit
VAEEQPAAPTFEAALAELETVVRQLEAGDLPLEESLRLFERGMTLSELCRAQLDEAEQRVEILIKKGDKVQAEPFRPPKS